MHGATTEVSEAGRETSINQGMLRIPSGQAHAIRSRNRLDRYYDSSLVQPTALPCTASGCASDTRHIRPGNSAGAIAGIALGARGSLANDGASPAVSLLRAATISHSTAAVGGYTPTRHGAAEHWRSYPCLTPSQS